MITGGLAAVGAAVLAGALLASISGTEVTRFADPQIVESSGLVARGGTFVTTNDSGDSGRLFVVDQATGETLNEIPWSTDPEDVEALAPASGNSVWVADIGDNGADREQVSLSLVDLAGDSRTRTYSMQYPDGPADAEALLSHPITGQVFIVTKSVFGGEVLTAPTKLNQGEPNLMTRTGRVAGLVTDGAFFADGRNLILRNYTEAFVYAYPTLDLVGSFDLPEQEQGEGLAIAGPSSVYLSSEGIAAPILKVSLPADVRRAMRPVEPTPEATADASEPESDPAPATGDSEGRGWLWRLPTLGALAVASWVVLTATRRSLRRRPSSSRR